MTEFDVYSMASDYIYLISNGSTEIYNNTLTNFKNDVFVGVYHLKPPKQALKLKTIKNPCFYYILQPPGPQSSRQ